MLMTTAEIAEITATIPAIDHRPPTANMVRAYAIGKKYAHMDAVDAADAMTPEEDDFFWSVIDRYRNVEIAFAAGAEGAPMPTWECGWRYGDAPEHGQSRNNISGDLECGCSMMAVRNHGETGDMLSATFCAMGRPIRYYAGWLVTHRLGSDSEPLLVAPVLIQ